MPQLDLSPLELIFLGGVVNPPNGNSGVVAPAAIALWKFLMIGQA